MYQKNCPSATEYSLNVKNVKLSHNSKTTMDRINLSTDLESRGDPLSNPLWISGSNVLLTKILFIALCPMNVKPVYSCKTTKYRFDISTDLDCPSDDLLTLIIIFGSSVLLEIIQAEMYHKNCPSATEYSLNVKNVKLSHNSKTTMMMDSQVVFDVWALRRRYTVWKSGIFTCYVKSINRWFASKITMNNSVFHLTHRLL